jgi:hypothetical protein
MAEPEMTKFIGGPLDGTQAKTSAFRWLLPIPTPSSTTPPRQTFQHVYLRKNDTLTYQGEEPT